MITLKKQPGEDFVILNLSDPQLLDQDWVGEDPFARDVLKRTVAELVQRVKPQLITVTGDLACAGHLTAHKMLGEFLNSFQIPWAPILGNHDQQEGMAYIRQVVAAYEQLSYFTYEAGDPALGNGNYVIAIAENGKPVAGIVMMDSHDRFPYRNAQAEETIEWAKLYPEQVDWYAQQVQVLQQQGCSHTVLMTHIPIYAYRPAFQQWISAPGTRKVPIETDVGDSFGGFGYVSSQGVCFDRICSYPEDEGMFDMITALGSTKLVLAGHDHINNAVFDYKGIRLAYALKTGPGCYWRQELNGGTVICISDGGQIALRHEYVAL